MHLAYPTPLAVVTEHTPSIMYPYVNQRIHYKICGYNTTLCSPSAPPEHQPSRGWRSVLPGQSIGLSMYNLDDQQPGLTLNSILIRQPFKMTVALFASSGWDDRDKSLNRTLHSSDSEVVVREYYINNERYGKAYLSPNFNGKEYTGDMVEVDLETAKYNTVRLHGIETDFADYYSMSTTSVDGIDPYVKDTSKNKEDQVVIKRLQNVDNDLAGYQNGFSALSGTTSYGFMVPFFNGEEYHGKAIRLTCGRFNISMWDNWIEDVEFRRFRTVQSTETDADGNTRTIYEDVENDSDFSAIDVLDLATVDPDLRGFIGGFSHKNYAYFVPHFNGKYFSGKIARVDVDSFDAASVEVLDLQTKDVRLAGFYGGFSTNFIPSVQNGLSANFAYLVPYKNLIGPVNGANTKYTSDGYKANEVFEDQESIGGDRLDPHHHGLLTRLNLDTFDTNDVDFIDLQELDPDLRGFAGGFQGGPHGYLVPYSKGFGDYASKLVRFDLLDFGLGGIEVLDLAEKSDQLKGFVTGFAYETYAVLVPYQNGRSDVNYRARNQFAKLTRVNFNDFTVNGILTLDVSSVSRKNTPDQPDNDLRGFVGGFCAGSFMYLVPNFNGLWYGKMVRVDMRDYDVIATAQEAGESTDFTTGFKGVQEVDLQRFNSGLAGFSGGFLRLRPPPIEKFYQANYDIFTYATGLDRLEPKGLVFSGLGEVVGEVGEVEEEAPEIMPDGIVKNP
ncbi:hypothetical protein TL16_g08370 [Triparma laevis f. inornata]|uniref:Uncharacterized protein n=2 Tax=Triparma laevis TaxID=1534972 RepID=A0A9W7FEQ7_9STRA|nr:hypothetical protein TL16_g08370 [Triparma laevis f. inornata]GMI10942.1 hypothetical protein TrLO_g9294 [Triparma laevis f. longispina]